MKKVIYQDSNSTGWNGILIDSNQAKCGEIRGAAQREDVDAFLDDLLAKMEEPQQEDDLPTLGESIEAAKEEREASEDADDDEEDSEV